MILYIVFSSSIVVSTNFVEIFFSKESLKLFDIAKKFGLSNEIYIAKKGFDQNSSNELQKIAKELENLDIQLPSLQEQKKIVEFLDLTNKEINLLEELKNQKEKYYSEVFNNILKNGEIK